MTVSLLARRCGLSRGAILHYESIGLLKPARRTASNYRGYNDRDLERLQQICAYRNAGLKLEDIIAILDGPETGAAAVLKRRLLELDAEIGAKRRHQHAILLLLKSQTSLERNEAMTKEKWTSIMRSAGFTDDAMRRWHIEFEHSAPADHQQFLEYLRIAPDEIESIREWSRQAR
jgi:DNA-binding transcriptional MerR regulator